MALKGSSGFLYQLWDEFFLVWFLMLKYYPAMGNQIEPTKVMRNPTTHKAHRKEVFWQITLPFVIGTILLLALAIAASWGAIGEVRAWGDVGIIWVILLMFIPGLLLLIVLAALVYGLTVILHRLPEFALQAQNMLQMISWRVKQGADKSVEPILRIESARASLKSIFHK